MTEEKMRKTITAIVAAATLLLVFLLVILVYQFITLGVQGNREEKLQQEVTALEQQAADSGEYADWLEENGKLWLAINDGWRFPDGE